MLAGRADILDDIGDALETGPTHPDYTVLLIGVRGAGKTAMLNAVEDLAAERGWVAVSLDAASPGLLKRLGRSVDRIARERAEPKAKRRITSASVMGHSVNIEHVDPEDVDEDLRTRLATLGDALAADGVGLMITVDELHSGDVTEIRSLGGILQHVTRREGRPIAFVAAGLPMLEDSLLADKAATFLQRCSQYDIGLIDLGEARAAIEGPIAAAGGSIDSDALDDAAVETSGYAFMIQLVGFYTWKAAADPSDMITAAEVAEGVAEAKRRIGRLVLSPMWKELSDQDRRFVMAMATDVGPSRIADIAKRLDVDTNYAGVYRQRLIKAGMIVRTGHGLVDYAHHATREWVTHQPEYPGFQEAPG